MTTLSEEMQASPFVYVITINPLGKYGKAANDEWIPKTEWVKEFLPPFLKSEKELDMHGSNTQQQQQQQGPGPVPYCPVKKAQQEGQQHQM